MAWDWEEAKHLLDAVEKKGGLHKQVVRRRLRLSLCPFLRSARAHFSIDVPGVQAKLFLRALSPKGFPDLVEHAQAEHPGDKTSGCVLAKNILEHERLDISRTRVFAAAAGNGREDLTAEICPENENWFGATLASLLAVYTSIDDFVKQQVDPGTPVLVLRPCFVRVKPSLRGLLSR